MKNEQSNQYQEPSFEEWKQQVIDEINRINPNVSPEWWEEIEQDLELCKKMETHRHWSPSTVACDLLL